MSSINEILAAVDKIEAEEKRLKEAKKKIAKQRNDALKMRRKQIEKALGLSKPERGNTYYYDHQKKVRYYNSILDSLAKSVAAGRITIHGIDDE